MSATGGVVVRGEVEMEGEDTEYSSEATLYTDDEEKKARPEPMVAPPSSGSFPQLGSVGEEIGKVERCLSRIGSNPAKNKVILEHFGMQPRRLHKKQKLPKNETPFESLKAKSGYLLEDDENIQEEEDIPVEQIIRSPAKPLKPKKQPELQVLKKIDSPMSKKLKAEKGKDGKEGPESPRSIRSRSGFTPASPSKESPKEVITTRKRKSKKNPQNLISSKSDLEVLNEKQKLVRGSRKRKLAERFQAIDASEDNKRLLAERNISSARKSGKRKRITIQKQTDVTNASFSSHSQSTQGKTSSGRKLKPRDIFVAIPASEDNKRYYMYNGNGK